MPAAYLSHRTVIQIGGEAVQDFLQGLVTTDVAAIAPGVLAPAALLTPQGKILFDFLLSRSAGDGFHADIRADLASDFLRRLLLYRLHAKVTIEADPSLAVTALWDEAIPEGALADTRFSAPARVHRLYGDPPADAAPVEEWDRLRIRNGVAESGADFALSDIYPHDILMDKNGGIGFRKGCYVGQEVVSRMHHRGTARRRLAIVEAGTPLPPPGTTIEADGLPLGQLGSVSGGIGLAIVRTDRAAAAMEKGQALKAGNTVVSLRLPDWSGLEFEAGNLSTEA